MSCVFLYTSYKEAKLPDWPQLGIILICVLSNVVFLVLLHLTPLLTHLFFSNENFYLFIDIDMDILACMYACTPLSCRGQVKIFMKVSDLCSLSIVPLFVLFASMLWLQ